MKQTSLEKRSPTALKENAQYAVAFSVIALMLYVVGFPVLILAFVGALTFFVWRAVIGGPRLESRPIFEFYLLANEILRDDGRRWFGFEIKDTIERGEGIIRSMATAPPLVHFTLGALYQRIDDHTLAIKHLAEALEGSTSDEAAIVFPTDELRDYVRLLRKIERSPAESPQTSAAIRSLERLRKNHGANMLDVSRATASGAKVREIESAPSSHETDEKVAVSAVEPREESDTHFGAERSGFSTGRDLEARTDRIPSRVISFKSEDDRPATTSKPDTKARHLNQSTTAPERKTISEVLHDIYDENTG